MSLVEEYYELNEGEEISVIWKILQIIFYGCAGGLGVWCGFTLANLRLIFDNRCYLFAELKASPKNVPDQRTVNWERDSCCDYYQFSMVSSFIVAIIWGTLFLMCGNGGKSIRGLPQPWRIVWPSFIFNFIYFIVILSNAINIQKGTDEFCGRRFQPNRPESLVDNCKVLKALLKKDLYSTAFQIEVVVKTSWGCVLSWFILFLLPLVRIAFAVDFRLYKICVFKVDDTFQNKKEEILRITNYEEPRKLHFVRSESDLENMHKDSELESKRKTKTKSDRKSMRHNFNRIPLRSDTVFYESSDIRMLNREKKKRKSKVLDEAFGKSKPSFGSGFRKSIKIQSNSDVSSYSEIAAYRISRGLYNDEEDYNTTASMSSNQKTEFHEDGNESARGSEILAGEFDSNRFLKIKKQI